MKKSILIKSIGNNAWIAGVYYTKNIVYSLLNNSDILSEYNIYIFTSADKKDVYSDLGENVVIKSVRFSDSIISKVEMLLFAKTHNVKYIFPMEKNLSFFGIDTISWIPDFQHNYYPNLFDDKELKQRTLQFDNLAKGSKKMVLSSQSAYDDFQKFYHPINKKIRVVRFVSYIENNIRNLDVEKEKQILDKFNLSNTKYTCIMNQFWQHKNHLVVLDAIKLYFQKNPDSDFKFVFTGRLEDYRSPEYIERLKAAFNEEDIKKHSVLLGFIDRNEQIAIMKNAEYVIHPSLFEGWGTFVEDAKVLDKTILLSDIPVHREQKNGKCILFNPHDAHELANLIEQENAKEHNDDIEVGIADMKKRAKDYSKGFQELLEL